VVGRKDGKKEDVGEVKVLPAAPEGDMGRSGKLAGGREANSGFPLSKAEVGLKEKLPLEAARAAVDEREGDRIPKLLIVAAAEFGVTEKEGS